MMQKNYKQEFIRFLLDTGALRFGDFPHKNGGTIPYDINAAALKTGMQIATLGKFYAKCYLDKIGRRQTVLYGPAYKGIPIAISTSFALSANDLDIPFFFNQCHLFYMIPRAPVAIMQHMKRGCVEKQKTEERRGRS